MPPNYLRIYFDGRKLNQAKARELEQKLSVNPADDLTRIALIGYYGQHAIWKKAARVKAFGLALWLIQHHPTHPELPYFPCVASASEYDDLYEIGRSAWLEHVHDDCADVTILSHASKFFLLRDNEFAVSLIERARKIEPANQILLEDLAFVYHLGLIREYDQSWLQRAFEVHKELVASKPNDVKYLAEFATISLKAGEYALARETAEAVLRSSKAPNLAEIHEAHSVLGLLYLNEGDLDAAKCELLKGGIWPEFDLENELIGRGESKVVCAHLWRCMSVWKLGRIQLLAWLVELWFGGKPTLRRTLLLFC
ncbi:hypothetical protein KA344_05275 [bacterium]|jgi:tetratricopeptide (TPR) repeat protein|nr:hypothetical protein [bacterium]